MSLNRCSLARRFLVDNGFAMPCFAVLKHENKVAIGIEFQTARTVNSEANATGVGPGSDHEIILQAAFVAVIHEIDARINRLITNFAEVWNASTPLRRIIPDEVVAMS